jgi:hypothetical protein
MFITVMYRNGKIGMVELDQFEQNKTIYALGRLGYYRD